MYAGNCGRQATSDRVYNINLAHEVEENMAAHHDYDLSENLVAVTNCLEITVPVGWALSTNN